MGDNVHNAFRMGSISQPVEWGGWGVWAIISCFLRGVGSGGVGGLSLGRGTAPPPIQVGLNTEPLEMART